MAENVSFQDILGKLMSDPSAMELVKKLKDEIGSPAPPDAAEAAPAAESEPVTGTVLPAGITLPPEFAAKMPDILSTLGPMLGAKGGGRGGDAESKQLACLLRAVKPYLSPRRREAADSLIFLTELGALGNLIPKKAEGGEAHVQSGTV